MPGLTYTSREILYLVVHPGKGGLSALLPVNPAQRCGDTVVSRSQWVWGNWSLNPERLWAPPCSVPPSLQDTRQRTSHSLSLVMCFQGLCLCLKDPLDPSWDEVSTVKVRTSQPLSELGQQEPLLTAELPPGPRDPGQSAACSHQTPGLQGTEVALPGGQRHLCSKPMSVLSKRGRHWDLTWDLARRDWKLFSIQGPCDSICISVSVLNHLTNLYRAPTACQAPFCLWDYEGGNMAAYAVLVWGTQKHN